MFDFLHPSNYPTPLPWAPFRATLTGTLHPPWWALSHLKVSFPSATATIRRLTLVCVSRCRLSLGPAWSCQLECPKCGSWPLSPPPPPSIGRSGWQGTSGRCYFPGRDARRDELDVTFHPPGGGTKGELKAERPEVAITEGCRSRRRLMRAEEWKEGILEVKRREAQKRRSPSKRQISTRQMCKCACLRSLWYLCALCITGGMLCFCPPHPPQPPPPQVKKTAAQHSM